MNQQKMAIVSCGTDWDVVRCVCTSTAICHTLISPGNASQLGISIKRLESRASANTEISERG